MPSLFLRWFITQKIIHFTKRHQLDGKCTCGIRNIHNYMNLHPECRPWAGLKYCFISRDVRFVVGWLVKTKILQQIRLAVDIRVVFPWNVSFQWIKIAKIAIFHLIFFSNVSLRVLGCFNWEYRLSNRAKKFDLDIFHYLFTSNIWIFTPNLVR